MDYQYSPLNPIIWGIFIGAVVLIYGVVRAFRARYPDYPGERVKQHLTKQTQSKEEDVIKPQTTATAFAGAGSTEERRTT